MADTFSSLDKQIAGLEANLRLIDERLSEFVSPADPQNLQLVRDRRVLEAQLADLAGRRARLAETPCPYRGLEYFDLPHAANYFGREVMVQRLLAKLRESNFVAVVGPSGCGKSSLVRAGLLPALRRGETWAVEIFRPGDDPLRGLALALVSRLMPDASPVDRLAEARKLADHLRNRTLPITDVLAQWRGQTPGPARLLLMADQFEEAYTLCHDDPSRRAFLDALLAAADTPWVTVLFTLRADFYGRVLEDERFGRRVDTGLVNVLAMTRNERRAAVEQPALQAGCRFEEGLVERILDAVEDAPGDLPLLEFALTELWERQTADGLLTHAAYEASGEVSGAIAKRAEATLAGLSTDQVQAVRAVFTRLVRVARPDEGAGDTRWRTDLDELPAEALPLVRQLADARLLVTGRDPATGKEAVEVAHEALIRGWQTLQGWLNGDREFLLWRQRLRTLADIWDESGRGEAALLRGALLQEAEVRSEGRTSDLSVPELAFIEQSRQAAERADQEKEATRQRELQRERALTESERARAKEQARSAERLRHRAVYLGVALGIALLAVAATGLSFRYSQAAGHAARMAAANEILARQTAEASAELAQKQLARLTGEQFLREARDLKAAGDAAGAIARLQAASQADPDLKLDLKAEMTDVYRQVATKLVQEGEQLAVAGSRQEAIAKMQEALSLDPPLDTPVYVRIPAGEFIMGSDDANPNFDDNEKPQHTVFVAEFWIMRTEVTNAQYLRCVTANACKSPNNKRYSNPQFAREPVSDLSWVQANDYARWVGGRLPTEAEWEKACRGTDGRIRPWGNDEPTATLANYAGGGHRSWIDVGSYPDGASPYGLLDMVGNVWEWTNTLWNKDSSYEKADFTYPYRADDGREDRDSPGGRMIRGGSFLDSGADIRCAARQGASPGYRSDNGGFRVVFSGS